MSENKKTNRDLLKWIAIGLAGLAAMVVIFGAGMAVGGMKARFSYRWAESYHKNFAGPRGGFFGEWRRISPAPGDFIEGHGVFGEIIELNTQAGSEQAGFVIRGRGDMEKIIMTDENTIIKKGMETVKDDLKIGDRVVIIGSPNEEGQIEAKLIRLFDKELKNLPMPRKGPGFPSF